jgi:plasmid stabilization system protein ParE
MTMALPMKLTFMACDDLGRIWDAIAMPSGMWGHSASSNSGEAHEFARDFEKHCALIAENPEMGRERGELQFGMRSSLFRRHKIFYRVRGETVEIIRVLGIARDLAF